MSTRLGVNIDHIATVRQARRGQAPDPVEAARVCERAGATSIVCHLREDRRHMQDQDVRRLRQAVTTRFNLEMSIAADIVDVALQIRPDQVTLVPERRQELTTEGGLDVVRLRRKLGSVIRPFRDRAIDVSLFVDPSVRQLKVARDVGASIVELHTGCYANARTAAMRARELATLQQATAQGRSLGLVVAAGHGLDYDNVHAVAVIPDIEELNIGYAIIVRALSIGLEQAVREMGGLLQLREAHAIHAA